jgi:hypothetical protein
MAFYATHFTGQSATLGTYFNQSHDLFGQGITIKTYDLTSHLGGTPTGPPITSVTTIPAIAVTDSNPIPDGCCAALSYRADYGTAPEFVRDPVTHKVTARPRSRYRSRSYFGPVAVHSLLTDSTTKRTKFSSTFLNDALLALKGIARLTDAASNIWQLVVHSKKDATVRPAIAAWADDRPDYQRRRADQSSVRNGINIP